MQEETTAMKLTQTFYKLFSKKSSKEATIFLKLLDNDNPQRSVYNYFEQNPAEAHKNLTKLRKSDTKNNKDILVQLLTTDNALLSLQLTGYKKDELKTLLDEQNIANRTKILLTDGAPWALLWSGYKKSDFEDTFTGLNGDDIRNILNYKDGLLVEIGVDDVEEWINEMEKKFNATQNDIEQKINSPAYG